MKSNADDLVVLKEPVHSTSTWSGMIGCFISGVCGILYGIRVIHKNDLIVAGSALIVLGIGLIAVAIYFFLARDKTFEFVIYSDKKIRTKVYSLNYELFVNPVKRIRFIYEEPGSVGGDSTQMGNANLYAVFYNDLNVPVFGIFNSSLYAFFHFPNDGYEKLLENSEELNNIIGNIEIFDGPVQRIYELTEEFR